MAGQVNEGDDAYRAKCCELADELGFQSGEIFFQWCQLWMMRVRESKMDKAIAKWLAMRDLRTMFDKRGTEPS